MSVETPAAVHAEPSAAAPLPPVPPRVTVPSWQAIYIIWYRDVLRYWRDRTRLLASLAQPLLFLVVFGVGLGSSLTGGFGGRGGAPGIPYIQFVYPGIVGMAVLFTAIFSAMSVVWDREFGFLREILVAPINRASVATGKALGGATQAMFQGLIMLAVGPFIGVKLSVVSVLEVIPLLFVLAFALTCMGVAISARMRSMQGFQVVMNFLMMPMFFLSGALFPTLNLPGWMTALTLIDPVTYGISPIRAVVLGGADIPSREVDALTAVSIAGWEVPIWLRIVILLGFGVVMLGVAMRSFARRD